MVTLQELFKDRYTDKNQADIIRFYSYVDTSQGCWLWKGAKTRKGYGSFTYYHRGKALTLTAHRVSYVLVKGFFDESLQLLHSCDNPSCVNPAHLTPGTNMDNVLDKLAKNRQSRKAAHEGESTPRSILTEPEVVKIISLINAKEFNDREIGDMFGVSYATIQNIRVGRSWKHLNLPIDSSSLPKKNLHLIQHRYKKK